MMRPCSPLASSSSHNIVGCPGKAKVALGSLTYFPSPQTEHPLKLGTVDEDSLGRIVDGNSLGTVIGTALGNVDGLNIGWQSHRVPINIGRVVHWLGSRRPCSPLSSRSPQDIGGCPGNENIVSGSFTYLPSPQIEQGKKVGAGDGNSRTGVMLGLVEGCLGWQSHRFSIRSGRTEHSEEEI